MAWYDAVGAFGTLASGLGALGFGGSGGDGRGAQKRALKQNTRIQQEQWNLQQRAYYQGVRDRVTDATQAGIHPLFALGYQGQLPGVVGGMSGDFGRGGRDLQDVGYGISQVGRAGRQFSGLSTRLAKANVRISEAEADMAESRAARARQEVNYTRPPISPETVRRSHAQTFPLEDVVQVEPVPIPARASADSSRTAGSKPAWQVVEVAPGKYYYILQSDEGVSDALEGWGLPLAVWKNVYEGGKRIARKAHEDARRRRREVVRSIWPQYHRR